VIAFTSVRLERVQRALECTNMYIEQVFKEAAEELDLMLTYDEEQMDSSRASIATRMSPVELLRFEQSQQLQQSQLLEEKLQHSTQQKSQQSQRDPFNESGQSQLSSNSTLLTTGKAATDLKKS